MATTKKPKIDPRVAKLEKALEAAEAARARLAADYANLEKRAASEHEALKKTASHTLLEHLFPIFDNFYRASVHAPNIALEDVPHLSEDDFRKIFNYFNGLRLLEKQMEAVLETAGLTRVPTKGQPFDPHLHEAISAEASADVPADHIIDEVEAGWSINGKVVKPAKVRVSQG